MALKGVNLIVGDVVSWAGSTHIRMSKKSDDSTDENTRSPLVAFLMQLGIRIKWAIQQWGGLKAILMGPSSKPSFLRPKNAPKYDLITRFGFTLIWTITGFCRDSMVLFLYGILLFTGMNHLMAWIHGWLCNRLLKQWKASGFDASKEIPLPEFDWRNESPDRFFELFTSTRHPVVLRGFMKDTALLKELSWDVVMEKFAEEDVFLTKAELDGFEGKLKEVNDPKTYLHNSECLFNRYPYLRKLFQYERLEPYLRMKVGYEQIFVGRGGTGSPFHHAAVFNMFYMIDGTKKWWFIDPYDTYMAYPIAIFGKAAGVLMTLWPGLGNTKDFPLFQHCPIYSTELQPGDVLFNPPWWWHSIKNTSAVSVAVASRWHTDGICGHNLMMTEEDYEVDRFSSFAFMWGPASWGFMHGILQTPSPRFDDHTTLREKNNRYVHKQLEWNAKGGVCIFGVKAQF
jgi:mannose-6-phosphate isomerase-like protein (cupin superfamily)